MGETDRTNILIVDDMPEKLLVYQAVLEELGQNLVPVSSGAEALRQVLRRDFAVILLDVHMPDMDGFETARYIRQRKRSAHTPIIFLTAFTDEVRATEGYALGAVDYIMTPVVPDILRAKVRVFVELFQMRQQVAHQAEEEARRAAAEGLARRSAFLAEASRALTSSLDPDVTRQGLLRLVVPHLADLAAVTLTDGPEQPWKSETAWIAPEGEMVRRTSTLAEAPLHPLREAHDRVLTTGAPALLTGLNLPFPPGSSGGDCLRSAVVIPLVARDSILGALTLAARLPDPDGTLFDLSLLEDLAGRAAIALDNARLYRNIQENDQRKNEFLAMLAHELRNPLAPVGHALELFRRIDSGHPDLNWARDLIDRQFRHLVRLVDDLLDVSRITRGKINLHPEVIEIGEVVKTAVETSRPLIEEHEHLLHVSIPDASLRVRGDPARLTQVMTNLLNNAAKYTPRHGRIALAVAREGEEVVLRVQDTGTGIPREMLGKVFDLFTQVDRSLDRSQGGLGIGLTLVRRLVEMHGGAVQAFSEGPGRGSEFVVRLPLLGKESISLDRHLEPGRIPPSNGNRFPRQGSEPACRVLVVDDNADAAESLAVLLRMSGHEVEVAYNGPTALEAADSFRPEVVLLDIGLPELDGYEVARRLRENPRTQAALLIAVSGYGQDTDRDRSREAGFAHHLVKPIDFADLRALLPTRRRVALHDS
jgi:signal transduction histidine kinase/CheY-like chemotaxis protein